MAKVMLYASITFKERTLLDRLARGWSLEEIQKHLELKDAGELSALCETIKTKMKVRTLYQAVAYAIYNDMIYPFSTAIKRG